MASIDSWADFETIRAGIRHNTVDKLKQLITGLNEECHAHLSKSGKKQEIIDRILSVFDSWRASNTQDKWLKAKNVLQQLRNTGHYSRFSSTSTPAATVPQTSMSVNQFSNNRPAPYNSLTGTSAPVSRYDPYAPPPKMSTPSSSVPKASNLQFKASPFYNPDHAVTTVCECPESTGSTDRKTGKLNFYLTPDQTAKLKQSYQIRLFCTSSIFYTPQPAAFRTPTTTALCPIEFPQTCEVRVNGVLLTANLKGLKKKPGTAPPPDISKYLRGGNLQNNIEMIYVNSQQPPAQPKKYYLVALMVGVTSVDQLVDRLKKGKYRSCEEIKQQMATTSQDFDDVVVGPLKMSLKCPLSFMRINTACRSSHCVHPQCFDATSWYSMMEQTTTWLCPVCEKVLEPADLIMDGYFDDILKQCPDSVEDVMVEADGEWHTTDNKYASVGWKSTHAPIPPRAPSPPKVQATVKAEPLEAAMRIPRQEEICILDSDDEDEGQVKRELSPSFASRSSLSAGHSLASSVPPSQAGDVIDLTLDSEDEASPPPTVGQKRKTTDTPRSPTEEIWKKGRVDASRTLVHPGTATFDVSQIPLPARIPNITTLPPIDYSMTFRGTGYQGPPRGAGSSQLPFNANFDDFSRTTNGGHSKSRWQ
ncbi:SUMO ligase siz1 [Pleurotus pulmonarius]|nr:SUMO ligase siz1 [Pleurotus pulmonarius]